jgi:hypothetical protein
MWPARRDVNVPLLPTKSVSDTAVFLAEAQHVADIIAEIDGLVAR